MSKISLLVFAAASLVATVAAGCTAPVDDGSEPTGESQDHLLAGRHLSPSEVARLVRDAGFPESVVGKMVCTAKWESSFYERATNRNNNGSVDYGLFQINSLHFHDVGCPSSGTALFDATANAKCAYHVYKSQGVNAWYGYKAHRSECDSYRAPSSGAAPPSSSSGGTPPPADDGTDPNADLGGGCYSATLADMQDANTCVQSKFDSVWYQCHDGQWYRGVSGSSGPYGACTSQHALP